MKLGFLTIGLQFVKKHKRILITGGSIAASTLAVVFALKDGPECARLLEELNAKDATTMEKAKVVMPKMFKTAMAWAVAVGLAVLGHTTASATIDGLSTSLTNAYLINKLHEEDQRKAIESVVGPEMAKKIDEEALRNQAERSYKSNDILVKTGADAAHPYITGHGNQLFYDADLNFWFRSSDVWIDKAHNTLTYNVLYAGDGQATENDYRDILGVPANRFDGEHRVWIDNEIIGDHRKLIEPIYHAANILDDSDGTGTKESYIILKHDPAPRHLSDDEIDFGYPWGFRK